MRIPGADKAVRNLIKWSAGDEWSPMLEMVAAAHFDDFALTEQELSNKLGDSFSMIYGWMLEDFFTAEFDQGTNVIDDYLKRRGWREKVPAKRYLQSLRDSSLSLYEVVDVESGHAITVRDVILGGDAVRVNEMSGSQFVHQWDRVAARIVTVNKKIYFTGSLLPFYHEAADKLLAIFEDTLKGVKKDLRREAKKRGETADFNDADLKKFILDTGPDLFSRVWLTETLERLAAPLPEIRNTDGHEMVFMEVRFPIKGEAAKIVAALDKIDELECDEPGQRSWTWHGEDASSRKAPKVKGITLFTDDGSGSPVLGGIEIKDKTLVLHANSRERADRGRDILLSRLGELLGPPLMSLQTLDLHRKSGELPPHLTDHAFKLHGAYVSQV